MTPEPLRLQQIRSNLAALEQEGTLNDFGPTGDLRWLLARYDRMAEELTGAKQLAIRQGQRLRKHLRGE